MISNVSGSTDKFLADLDRIQSATDRAQREITSGLKVEVPSDAPDEIRSILQLRAEIQRNTQIQTNLTTAKTDVQSGDTAVQSAIQILDRASVLGTQGAGSTSTADQRASMAQEVGQLLDSLVSLSRTTVGGRYIFSGDQENLPSYALDSSSPTGVNRLLASPANTRQIQGVDGLTFGIALTAQDVFDRRNADDTPAGDNVFAAVNALQTALQNNDEAGIQSAMQSVQAASSHLNSQLVFYGTAENRIKDALDQASHMETQENTALSQEVDADIAAASTELALNNTHQQAALAARSKLPQTTLFDFLA